LRAQRASGLATMAPLTRGEPAVWLRPATAHIQDESPLQDSEVVEAQARLSRFRPALRALFPEAGWDGHIQSPLIAYPDTSRTSGPLLVKCDHALPMTGSVKARGGVYELLCHIEDLAEEEGLLANGEPLSHLLSPQCREVLARRRVVVASTGNLGFSIGLVARGFGLQAEIHMSHDAKAWKKTRLTALEAQVVEHPCDYTETVALARASAEASNAYFIDDENSRRLFVGYATAARELADQLVARGLEIGPDAPLVVYLPCGVGGAPGGITAGLKAIYGRHVRAVFVEPVASASMFAALAVGEGAPVSVYDYGLDNDTIADGLAVPIASRLVLKAVGRSIDAAVAVTDRSMLIWVQRAWREAGLRLEPSAASGFAAAPLFRAAIEAAGSSWSGEGTPVQVVWATGGSLLPEAEFAALFDDGGP
jgi:D-serine dehydratase